MNTPHICPFCTQPILTTIKREGITKPAIPQIERERQETAFYLRVVWREICGEASTHHSMPEGEPQP